MSLDVRDRPGEAWPIGDPPDRSQDQAYIDMLASHRRELLRLFMTTLACRPSYLENRRKR